MTALLICAITIWNESFSLKRFVVYDLEADQESASSRRVEVSETTSLRQGRQRVAVENFATSQNTISDETLGKEQSAPEEPSTEATTGKDTEDSEDTEGKEASKDTLSVQDNKETRPDDDRKNATSSLPPCLVILENRQDYHYEIFESTLIRYPLPWNNFTCDSSQPIRMEVAHADTSWYANELEGWLEYYNNHLKGTVRDRPDGKQVIFGDAMHFKEYEQQQRNETTRKEYHAVIGGSCGTYNPKSWIQKGSNRYCVLHIKCNEKDCDNTTVARGCWLNPMHECFYNPIDFPKFEHSKCPLTDPSNNLTIAVNIENDDQVYDTNVTKIKICTVGGAKRHDVLASVLPLLERNDDIIVWSHGRNDKPINAYANNGVGHLARSVHFVRYLEFEESISRCDLLLPLVDPDSHTAGYFPHNAGKLTGSLAQAMGYNLPTVMHEELAAVYGPYLAEPKLTYTSNHTTFVDAMNSMLDILRKTLPQQRREACDAKRLATI